VLYNLHCACGSVDLLTHKVAFALLISSDLLQTLRSVSSWSIGFLDTETVEESIHEAYIDAITRAKHYVYIENQFFISLATHNTSVRNLVCETLFKRIMRAHK
jgi:phospholipase D1/2